MYMKNRNEKIRGIFGLEENNGDKDIDNKIRVSYNETVYFKPSQNYNNGLNGKLSEILQSVITKSMENTNCDGEKTRRTESIKLNVNINNNFYNSNCNYQTDTDNHICHTRSSVTSNPRKTTMSLKNEDAVIFIQCVNCGSEVHEDDIESHSMRCTKVTEEVMQAENTRYSYQTINYKLKRLQEHVTNIKSGDTSLLAKTPEISKEMQYISTVLFQYLTDSISFDNINLQTIKELKKIMTNLDILSLTYKGSISSLILIDRTRVLINEKLLIFKDDYKRLAKTRLLNDQRTGNILYEDKLKEEIQKLKKIEIEKELMMNKVNNLQKNQAIPEKESQQIEDDESVNDDDLEVKKIHALKNKLDEINSDLDNLSDKSGVSDCTSMTSTNSFSSFKDQPVNDLQKELSRSSNEANDRKEFIKLVLKIKFEKLHNSHKGQNVNERSLYEECQRNQIPKDRWPEFILQELNTPAKYLSQTRKSLKKVCSLAHLR